MEHGKGLNPSVSTRNGDKSNIHTIFRRISVEEERLGGLRMGEKVGIGGTPNNSKGFSPF